ncbi:MAG: SAM-dependent methyltransferase [Nitrospirae bacterium]|nr:SAM-dependent methyltransferase [Nitrospirota bacterium]MBI3352356.1 SAM-dependent methyltransferase [Nitrospirota bacterium]
MISGNPPLLKKIIAKIKADGPLSFKTFMEMALYDPEGGYYSSSREPFGVKGDFYTSPGVHPLFGRMLARQIAEMAEAFQDSSHFDLVEIGSGNGSLALQIFETLREDHPGIFKKLFYYLVEASPSMIQRQKEAFQRFPEFLKKSKWVALLKELPKVEGCIFSNELVDAFPVYRVVWRNGKLLEIHVDFKAKQLVEVLLPPSLPEIERYFDSFNVHWIDGQEAEVNLNAIIWVSDVADILKRGFVLTIDYGDLAEGLYSVKRKRGTFLCYRNHQTQSDPYQWVGEQDMTSHVNFSMLQNQGMKENLFPLGYTDQSHFLIGLGIIDEMERFVQTVDDPIKDLSFRAMKHLIHPEGLGPVFKVLIQQKGMGSLELKGLKFYRK